MECAGAALLTRKVYMRQNHVMGRACAASLARKACMRQNMGAGAFAMGCAGAASLARKVYMRQNVGVGAFAKQYGGRNKRKGTVPEHYARASRGLIRHILKQVTPTAASPPCHSPRCILCQQMQRLPRPC